MQVNILEARNRLSELIRCALPGEDGIIANRGRAVARLVAEGNAPMGSARKSGQTFRDGLAAHPMPACRFGLRMPDALDLACAPHHRCSELWTNDDRSLRAGHGLARNVLARFARGRMALPFHRPRRGARP